MGKLKLLTFGFLALDFPHQFSSLSFVCPRATLNQFHALAHPVRGWEDQKLVMLVYDSGVNCSCPWITWAGDKEVSKPRFYFCPDQQLAVWPFASHLTALSLCEMRMEELWSPYLSPRVTLSGKVSGDAQNRLLKALAWGALRLTRYINEAEARWAPMIFQ